MAPGGGRASWFYRAKPAITQKHIVKTSLKETLEAHRAANRDSIVRPVDAYNSPTLGVYRPPRHEEFQKPSLIKKTASKTREAKPEKKATKLGRVSFSLQRGEREAQHPWLDLVQQQLRRKDGRATENGMSRLDAEITALAEYLRPSPSENVTIARIVHQISKQVFETLSLPPQLVGSRFTHTAFSSSGIDLMVRVGDKNNSAPGQPTLNSMSPEATRTFASTLEKVEGVVRQIPDYDEFRIIQAKSPTLFMIHKASNLPINIFCGNRLPSSDHYIKTILASTPSLQPLYMVLRAILESRNIFGWEAASVDTYGLILLIAACLKQQNAEFQKKGLGEQLLAVLDTYGSKFNPRTTGVSAEPAEFFDFASVLEKSDTESLDRVLVGQRALAHFKANASKRSNFRVTNHLCIQDPTNHLNDVGLQCVRTTELQMVLSSVADGLQQAVKQWDGGILGQGLQANFDDFERVRSSLTV